MARYWSAKVDQNHAAIRQCFREAGWQWADLHRVKGLCDGMVLSPWQTVHLVEVKRLEGKRKPKASTNAKQATKDAQKKFAETWPVVVLTTVEEARKWRDGVADAL